MHSTQLFHLCVGIAGSIGITLSAAVVSAADVAAVVELDVATDFLLLRDPEFPQPRPPEPAKIRLPIEALREGDAEEHLAAAEQILVRLQQGTPAGDDLVDLVATQLTSETRSPQSRRTLVALLIAADASEYGDLIWQQSQHDELLRIQAERALADWQHEAAVDVWRDRITRAAARGSQTPTETDLLLAIRGLTAVDSQFDAEPLVELLRTSRSAPIAVAAARCLSSRTGGRNVELARRIFDSGPSMPAGDTSLIVALLIRHTATDEAHGIAVRVLNEGSAVARAVALEHIADFDPQQALQIAPANLQDADPKVRRLAVEILRTAGELNVASSLAEAFDDSLAAIRDAALAGILQHREQERQAVLDILYSQLRSDAPRRIEQAVIGLGLMSDSAQVERVAQLIAHPDERVRLFAAWALKQMDVPRPSLELAAERVQSWRDDGVEGRGTGGGWADQLQMAHLMELLGLYRYRPISTALEDFIPKAAPFTELVRSAAIWSLGRILEETEPPAGLVAQLEKRFLDFGGEDPEMPAVIYAATIAAGRLGNKETLKSLARMDDAEAGDFPIGPAVEWARRQIEQRAGRE